MKDVPYDQAPHWTRQAACAAPGAPYMFPHEHDRKGNQDARDTCRSCPVQATCRDEAVERGEEYGVWGGLNAAELRKLRGGRRRPRTGGRVKKASS